MVISEHKVVALSYELRLNSTDGEKIEVVNADKPLTFIYGTGAMLPKFEENLKGLKTDDTFNFKLESNDAYGIASDEQIIDLPKDIFTGEAVDEKNLEIGVVLPMQDNNGNRFNGKIIAISESVVTMDFNHPLAGETLFFKGRIIEVRDATSEELERGHLGGGCCCGEGGCGNGECDDDKKTEEHNCCGCH